MNKYNYIADLFRYPTEDIRHRVLYFSQWLQGYDPVLYGRFKPFVDFYLQHSIRQLEEYYIQTFDVQATCHLDIGYIVFGDDAKRGRFLYHVKEEQEKNNNDCGTELADFLPNMLTLLAISPDRILVEELSVSILLPALHVILQKLENNTNSYQPAVHVLISLLENEFSQSEYEAVKIGTQQKPNFLNHYVTGIDVSLFKRKQLNRKT